MKKSKDASNEGKCRKAFKNALQARGVAAAGTVYSITLKTPASLLVGTATAIGGIALGIFGICSIQFNVAKRGFSLVWTGCMLPWHALCQTLVKPLDIITPEIGKKLHVDYEQFNFYKELIQKYDIGFDTRKDITIRKILRFITLH